ncbi:ccr4 associated factor, partial [Kickxella alabastrina]
MGLRLLLPKFTAPTLPASFEERPASEYALRRILKGVPEGCDDFVPDVSVPLECNMDYMHGVHFSKGCYVGQELTIRTHHRGVVRKRIVPVIFGDHPWGVDRGFDPRCLPQPHADIVRVAPAASADQGTEQGSAQGAEARPARARKVPPGKTGSAIFNAGLALMRLEHVEQFMAQPGQAVVFETTGADVPLTLGDAADEKHHKYRCRDLKRQLEELEEYNEILAIKLLRSEKCLRRMKIERNILLERFENSRHYSNYHHDDSESDSDAPLKDTFPHPPASDIDPNEAHHLATVPAASSTPKTGRGRRRGPYNVNPHKTRSSANTPQPMSANSTHDQTGLRKPRMEKDPNAPRRPANAFVLYCQVE